MKTFKGSPVGMTPDLSPHKMQLVFQNTPSQITVTQTGGEEALAKWNRLNGH